MSLETRMLTGRDALVACSVCRNQATRAIDDIADQVQGFTNTKVRRAAGAADAKQIAALILLLRGLKPAETRLIQVPTGTGTVIEILAGQETALFSAEDWWAALANMRSSDRDMLEMTLRQTAQALRQRSRSCCEEAVTRRLSPQRSNYTKEPHKHIRRRTR